MKDIVKMVNEACEETGDENARNELFAEKLLAELKGMKGTDISPYLSCTLEAVRKEYAITLRIPIDADIFNSERGDSE